MIHAWPDPWACWEVLLPFLNSSAILRVGLSEGPFVLVEVLDEQVLPAELAVVAKVVHPLPPFEVHLVELGGHPIPVGPVQVPVVLVLLAHLFPPARKHGLQDGVPEEGLEAQRPRLTVARRPGCDRGMVPPRLVLARR
eukprot:CAMPEP_0181279458 /NCGR_PEP_ID=MMETSP1097-20121128/12346_1 /TAXON_ID=35684 /ORGANISM="Pseudopedinella elastica, Strain CCMP716" /LENGTH=138 /DNA_ID=CAMNT_0023381757 /DNA_START=32 /DNA_END=445 /DNA_ORIENTATION=-